MYKKKIRNNIESNSNRSERGDFFIPKKSKLVLESGETFTGKLISNKKEIKDEIVFNTGMTGYIESLTDPSYTGQILVFTYPLIGNYGVDINTTESNKIQVSGVIVSELVTNWSHQASTMSLVQWLKNQNIPLLYDVDTRALTKFLRSKGTMYGAITDNVANLKFEKKQNFVTINQPKIYESLKQKIKLKRVILVDCGAKENILRSLLEYPISVKRVPYDYDFTNEEYDGVLISNGPGDPTNYQQTISIIKKAFNIGKPIFGICLGNQIIALAAGSKTYKLKFGHRGHNQPCLELESKRGYITSQNHGYAVYGDSLPNDWKITYKNINDGSVEGIAHNTKPFYAVQFHPEAAPGPTDTHWLFERFYKSL